MGQGKDMTNRFSQQARKAFDVALPQADRDHLQQRVEEVGKDALTTLRQKALGRVYAYLDAIQSQLHDDGLSTTPTIPQDTFNQIHEAAERVRRSHNIFAPFDFISEMTGLHFFSGTKPEHYEEAFASYERAIASVRRGLKPNENDRAVGMRVLLHIHVPNGEKTSQKETAEQRGKSLRTASSTELMRLPSTTLPESQNPFFATTQNDGTHIHVSTELGSIVMGRLTDISQDNDNYRRYRDHEYRDGKPLPLITLGIGNAAYTMPLEWVHPEGFHSLAELQQALIKEANTALLPVKK